MLIVTPSYWLFVAFAAVAIATPGPGVLLTVSNALRYGFTRSFPGVLELAIGMLGVGASRAQGWVPSSRRRRPRLRSPNTSALLSRLSRVDAASR